MRTFIAALLLSLPAMTFGACQNLLRLEASVDLTKKSWETIELEKEITKVCVPLNDQNANLEIVFRKEKKEFRTKIYSALDGYYDYQTEKKKMSGGRFPLTLIFLETWAPEWAKDSSVTVTEIQKKIVLAETKL